MLSYEALMATVDLYEAMRTLRAVRRLAPDPVPDAVLHRVLEIPEPWATAAVVPLGYPKLRGHGPISRRPVEKMAFRDACSRPFAPVGSAA